MTVITADITMTMSAITSPATAPEVGTFLDKKSVGGEVVFSMQETPATLTLGYIALPSAGVKGSLGQSITPDSVPAQDTLLYNIVLFGLP